MRPSRAVYLLATLTAGCLPGRDNPNDPNNSPEAVLVVVDQTGPDGTCPVNAVRVDSAPIGHCLALDANGSERANGSTSGLEYSFFVVTTAGAVALHEEPTDSPFLVLGTAERGIAGMIVGRATTFEVSVRDPSKGSRATAEAVFVPSNSRPIAVAGPSRTLPAGGYPWALSVPFTLRFDGSASHDADRDDLLYCWTFPELPPDPPCSPDPVVEHDFPSSERAGFTAELRVFDGTEYSPRTISPVIVSDRPVWIAGDSGLIPFALDDGNRVMRLDTETRKPRLQLGFGPQHAIRVNEDQIAWLDDIAGTLNLASLPDASGSSSQAIAGGASGLGAAPDGGLWVYTYAADLNSAQRFPPGPLPVTPSAPISVPQFSDAVNGDPWFAVDGYGDAWGTTDQLDDTQLLHRFSGGQSMVMNTSFTISLASLTARPGTTEMWSLELASTDAPATQATGRIVVYDGPVTTVAYTLPGMASGLAWMDARQFWLSLPGRGAVLVDADLLETGLSIDESVVAEATFDASVTVAIADPLTGTYWAAGEGDTAVSVSIDGGTLFWETAPLQYLVPHFVDAAGVPWWSRIDPSISPSVHYLDPFQVPRADRALTNDYVPQVDLYQAPARNDASTGGLWLVVPVPNGGSGFAHLDDRGTVREVITRVRFEDGTESAPPYVYGFETAPDGGSLFSDFYGLGLHEIELSTRPPLARYVMPGNAQDPDFNMLHMFEPTADGLSFWTYSFNGNTVARRSRADGAVQASTSLPGELFLGFTWAAAHPKTGGLCLATGRPTVAPAGEVTLRHLSPAGAITPLGTATMTIFSNDLFWGSVAAWNDETNDVCWTAVGESNGNATTVRWSLFAHRTDGVLLHSLAAAADGVITSISPLSADEVWVTVASKTGTVSKEELRLITFTGVSTANTTVLPVAVHGKIVDGWSY